MFIAQNVDSVQCKDVYVFRGHDLSPYEQNTQQSPRFALIMALQLLQM